MNDQKERLGTLPFVLGGMSFIPLLGIPFGVLAIAWGLGTKKEGGRKLALVGAGGISATVLLYSALFYFGFSVRGGAFDEARAQLSRTNLGGVVQAIEFYRVQNGQYPDSLAQLRTSLQQPSFVFLEDVSGGGDMSAPRPYYYEVVDSAHYYLLGVGADGTPFTADDVLPTLTVRPQGGVGLLIKGR